MRGVAAIAAAASVWVLVTGVVPRWRPAVPSLPGPAILAAAAGAGAASFTLAVGVLGIPSAAAAVACFGAAIPIAADGARRKRSRSAIASAWPDVLARTRMRVSSGATLVESFLDGLDAGPPELAGHRVRIEEAVRFGPGFERALDELRNDLDDPTADRVLVTIAAAHRSGGRKVGEVLAALATSVADELRLRASHDAAMTEQRLTAVVALVAPWVLLALTVATNSQARASYVTGRGTVVIVAGAAATALGFGLARRSARLDEAPRVFR